MLLIHKSGAGQLAARFLARANFVECEGVRDAVIAQNLLRVFASADISQVRSLRIGASADAACWFDAGDWWLSCAALET